MGWQLLLLLLCHPRFRERENLSPPTTPDSSVSADEGPFKPNVR
jgi:hypothetical protein